MTDTKHENLRRLFDLVIATAKSQRSAMLARECGDDAELRARIAAMVEAAESDSFLVAPTGAAGPSGAATSTEAARSANSADLREGPGTRIGPYKLLQQIGEGGFGVVFSADQEKPVVRRVALKIIKLGMDTRVIVARFEQERQALAMMDHPHIARVLDAGATETGRPYFVMDLVKGDPIGEYCDKNNLTIDERLELFSQVCAAVQHAHTKGIIHRDIKPSNVLVATQDGHPHAKVIDFGIAKATSAKLTDKTLFTEHQQVIGTLQYMSPEQAQGSIDIDTRTDVYSLGVLLYELLTGSTPFDANTLRDAMYSEIQRMIREVEPPRPSTRLSASHEMLASIAAHRRTEPKRLGTILRGELDWIVMKALEKDRARRYETANGLALDIRRYLSGDAVMAAPPSAAYRVEKFVRRNKVIVGACALIVLAIALGATLAGIGFVQASRQRDLAISAGKRASDEAERAESAEKKAIEEAWRAGNAESKATAQATRAANAEATAVEEAESAKRIAEFLTSMLMGVGPRVALGRDTTLLREILDNTAERIDKELQGQPAVAGRLSGVIAMVYNDLAVLDKAEPLARRAIELQRGLPGDHRSAIARALYAHARVLESMGRYDAAKDEYRESSDVYSETGQPDSDFAVTALSGLGGAYFMLGDYEAAEPIFRDVVAKSRKLTGGNEAMRIASALDRLSVVVSRTRKGSTDEAVDLAREALAIRRQTFGDVHPDIALSLSNLAGILAGQKHFDEALDFAVQATEQHRKLFGERHPQTAAAIRTQANILNASGKSADAIRWMRIALDIDTEKLGPDHRVTLDEEFGLGGMLDNAHDFVGAEEHYRALLRWGRANYSTGDNRTSAVIMLVANAVANQRRYADAEVLYREALAARIANRPAGHAQIVESQNALADCLVASGRQAEAETLLVAVAEAARSPEVRPTVRAAALERIVAFYGAWEASDPNKNRDASIAEWNAKLAPSVPESGHKTEK